jgi:hypothetical protein
MKNNKLQKYPRIRSLISVLTDDFSRHLNKMPFFITIILSHMFSLIYVLINKFS